MATKKGTRSRSVSKLDELRRARPDLFVEYREPSRPPGVDPVVQGAIYRARMLRDELAAAIALLERDELGADERAAVLRIVDGAYFGACDTERSTKVRMSFMRAIDTAAALPGGTSQDALRLFAVLYPEEAMRLDPEQVREAIAAWRSDKGKWTSVRRALSRTSVKDVDEDSLARYFRKLGGSLVRK